ncbi:Sporulation domain-containing protein [Legionella brunensis]|uniref:Sporulation domain-containing protein n=2 Tax=Legionella brunensis TaxID=29422 RepID=A0A0W0S4I9_9GAMM|nr:Sporulation domain-containing protein [Legionella brunensis]
MKLVMDERVKHRLIGLAVILSIAAIFAPAVIKKSNQRIDDNVSVSVQLPPKPTPPKVAMPEEKEMFETVKVAHVEIPDVPEDIANSTLAKAESLSQLNDVKQAIEPMVAKAKIEPSRVVKQKPAMITAATTKATTTKVATKKAPSVKPKIVASIKKPTTIAKKPTANMATGKGRYAVQLATFSKRQNADSLVSRLRAKGYKASYNKVNTAQGTVYKVIVGQGHPKEQAQRLQQQLASVMQIKGFIVTTGVS